jgi:hypothetical protein
MIEITVPVTSIKPAILRHWSNIKPAILHIEVSDKPTILYEIDGDILHLVLCLFWYTRLQKSDWAIKFRIDNKQRRHSSRLEKLEVSAPVILLT